MQAINFVKHFLQDGKLVAAMGHGSAVLLKTELVRGRKVAADPSLQSDFANAGGQWVDEPMVTDREPLTYRAPGDSADLIRQLILEIGQGVNMAGRGIAARESLTGEGAEVPNYGHRFGRG